MSSTRYPRKGEVWYVNIPNQPHDPHQPGTAIIVSRDSRNAAAADVMLVPIFSQANAYSDCYVDIPANSGGMPHQSVAKCDQVTTVHKSLLTKGPLGERINQALMWKIHYAVRKALGETRLP